jgi:hypothetical protein
VEERLVEKCKKMVEKYGERLVERLLEKYKERLVEKRNNHIYSH